MNPNAAAHLAELEARYAAHMAALQERAQEAKDAVDSGMHAIESTLPHAASSRAPLAPFAPPPRRSNSNVEEPPPYVAPPPNPYAEHALIPDVPLGKSEPAESPPAHDPFGTVDDDGIPLWQD